MSLAKVHRFSVLLSLLSLDSPRSAEEECNDSQIPNTRRRINQAEEVTEG